jgi:hypothetical protein
MLIISTTPPSIFLFVPSPLRLHKKLIYRCPLKAIIIQYNPHWLFNCDCISMTDLRLMAIKNNYFRNLRTLSGYISYLEAIMSKRSAELHRSSYGGVVDDINDPELNDFIVLPSVTASNKVTPVEYFYSNYRMIKPEISKLFQGLQRIVSRYDEAHAKNGYYGYYQTMCKNLFNFFISMILVRHREQLVRHFFDYLGYFRTAFEIVAAELQQTDFSDQTNVKRTQTKIEFTIKSLNKRFNIDMTKCKRFHMSIIYSLG